MQEIFLRNSGNSNSNRKKGNNNNNYNSEDDSEDNDSEDIPTSNSNNASQLSLDTISEQYELQFSSFLETLSKQSDENLLFLCQRLDFNEFYQNKQHKITKLLDSFVQEEDEDAEGEDNNSGED